MKNYDNNDINCMIDTLKIISNIKKDQKIIIRDDKLVVDDRYFQSLRRWYANDNRYLSIIFIETVILKSIELESEIVDYIKTIKTDRSYSKEDRDENIKSTTVVLNKLSKGLNDSTKGLSNLKETYKNDSLITEKLDLFLEQIDGDE